MLCAAAAAILLAASCLNPQPDDFPQANADSPSSERATQGPADIRPVGAADHNPAPQAPITNSGATPPAASAPGEAPANASPTVEADAGAPAADGGLPDATPVVAR